VGIMLPNRNEFLEALFGIVKIGGVVVPLNCRRAPAELQYICEDCGITSLIFDADFNQTVNAMKRGLDVNECVAVGSQVPVWAKDITFIDRYAGSEPVLRASGDDPAVILYTSGTTGHPKGVVRQHSSYLWISMGFISTLESRRIIALVVPLYQGWGFNFAITAVHRGDTVVLLKAFDPNRVLEVIRDEKVDTMLAVPAMLQRMAQVPHFDEYLTSLNTLEMFEILSPQLREKYSRQTIRRTYGLTETGFITVATISDLLKKPDSEGFPLLCTEVGIVDGNGLDLPSGEVGEIVVKGPTLMKEYWGKPEATKQVFRDGWFHTGDLGRFDECGRLYIAGRIKEVIKSGGEIISPAEVERVLHQHPNILEAGVIGRPDSVWGERVCAVIRLRDGTSLSPEDIRTFCQDKLARFESPKEIIFTTEALPHDPYSGKLLRNVLRERLR